MSTKEKLPVREKMRIIHDSKRPTIDDYTRTIFDDFIELHGDRGYVIVPCSVCGTTTMPSVPVSLPSRAFRLQ